MDTVILFGAERGGKNAPAAPFMHERGNFEAVREVIVTTKSTWTDTRQTEVRQPMTYLGPVKSHLVDGPSDLDGVTGKYVSPEGDILVDSLREELEERGGVAADISELWSWKDNQVALLVNMLRYAMLKCMDEATEDGLRGEIPDIVEGTYRFCTRTIWDEGYPEGGKMMWPGGDDAGSYPAFELLSDLVPRADLPTINLRGLNEDRARFVLMMCGKWNRQSRYRLDFELPRLAQMILYRSDGDREIRLRVGEESPPMLTSNQAYCALEVYVANNRLLAQMSVARGLVFRTYCQYLPVTIDGAAWLQTEWVITLPVFRAVRGRFTFLAVGDYPLSRRGFAETLFFVGKLDALNFAGIATCQTLYYGMAVRSFRWSSEDKPEDLVSTECAFAHPDYLTSAAIAEVISAPVAKTGMDGIDIRPINVSKMGRNEYTRIALWLKCGDSDTPDSGQRACEVKTAQSAVERERVLQFVDDIRGDPRDNEELDEHILRYADLQDLPDDKLSAIASRIFNEVEKIKESRKTVRNLADLFAEAVLDDQRIAKAEPEGSAALAKWTKGEWEPKKPVLTEEEIASGVGLTRVILESWPIPGVPTFVRQATGQRDFRLLDKHYDMRIKDLNRNQNVVRGDIGQMWKFALMMKLMGWEVELDMRGSEDFRKNFAYTPDGNVPIPPCQSPAGRAQSVVVTSLERGKHGAWIVDPRMAGEDVVIQIDDTSLGDRIFLPASGDKGRVTTVSNPWGNWGNSYTWSRHYSPGVDMDSVLIRSNKRIVRGLYKSFDEANPEEMLAKGVDMNQI